MIGKFRKYLSKIKEPWLYSNNWARKSYSQEGEDLVLDRLMGGVSTGFYVDVGSHHPFRFSNTFLFYRRGWSGLCIDPLPGTKALFNRWRPRDLAIEMGVSGEPKVLKYYMFNEPALNTFDFEIANEKNGLRQYKIVNVQEIKTAPLAQILDSYLPAGAQVDMFSVDVEGLDLQVLKSNDWNKHRPRYVVAECLKTDLEVLFEDAVVSFLREVGYRAYAKTGNSVIFVKRD